MQVRGLKKYKYGGQIESNKEVMSDIYSIREQQKSALIDTPSYIDYPCARPGRPGAAEPAEPRQGREAATVR